MKKYFCYILMLIMSFLCLQGCGKSDAEVSVNGKIYVYTGESRTEIELDKFTISINEDGTFSYYETMISSYIGFGKWTLEGDILTLTEDPDVCYPYVHYFRVDGDDLIFIEEGSDNFLYTKLKDGERFSSKLVADEGFLFEVSPSEAE